MRQVQIETMQSPYPIAIGAHILPEIKKYVTGKCVVVTDSNVAKLHLDKLTAQLGKHKVIVVPAGEESKSQQRLFELYDGFAAFGLNRKDTVIGFGGGVVGDLCGYAAGSYMRGVPYVAVPTTLLAMVDSSVGGKVAINHPAGKNLIGMFYQPKAVIADTSLLSTLESRQVACGMAEIIKYGCIADEALFWALKETQIDIDELVERCVKIKEMYVKEDTFDKGRRMMLNFGHTIGHGVENGCGYGVVLHGEGVAIGMVKEAQIGEKLGITAPGTHKRIAALCQQHGLPTELPDIPDLLHIMSLDKKSESDSIQFALIEDIGKEHLIKIDHKKLEGLL